MANFLSFLIFEFLDYKASQTNGIINLFSNLFTKQCLNERFAGEQRFSVEPKYFVEKRDWPATQAMPGESVGYRNPHGLWEPLLKIGTTAIVWLYHNGEPHVIRFFVRHTHNYIIIAANSGWMRFDRLSLGERKAPGAGESQLVIHQTADKNPSEGRGGN